MKSLALCLILVLLSFAGLSCAFQNKTVTSSPPSPQKANVSNLVADDLGFAKSFVKSLSDAGWTIQEVRHSKFNSFFSDSRQAAFIKTDKGIIEAVFFQSKADVDRIQVSERQTGDLQYHLYTVQKLPTTNQRIEGGVCYFTKYQNVFIITTDHELNDALNRLPV